MFDWAIKQVESRSHFPGCMVGVDWEGEEELGTSERHEQRRIKVQNDAVTLKVLLQYAMFRSTCLANLLRR